MSDETIKIVYEPLLTVDGETVYHETLLYTDSSGQQFISSCYGTQSGPQGFGAAASQSAEGASGSATSWGTLSCTSGATDSAAVQLLWPDLPKSLLNPDNPTLTVATGADLSAQWNIITDAEAQIAGDDLDYSPLTLNSNSAASTALIAAGITPPQNPVWAPASAVRLPTSYTVGFSSGIYDYVPALCFSAGTPILSADGARKPIEHVAAGDLVLAFDPAHPMGELKPARVTRVFRNVTEEWFVLDTGLTVTPGHRFLNEQGQFERIDAILARGGGIVGADGAAQVVTAQRVVYAQDARGLYEEAEELVAASSGSLALQPEVKHGWRTYNFEVDVVANDNRLALKRAM